MAVATLNIRHPSSTTTKLAEKMNITKSAISQQLVKLESEGYIIRKQHAEDKRTFSVELGETFHNRLQSILHWSWAFAQGHFFYEI